jgi:hypothetical protein
VSAAGSQPAITSATTSHNQPTVLRALGDLPGFVNIARMQGGSRTLSPVLFAGLILYVSLSGSAPIAAQERTLLWGDTHLHTSWSVDAFSMGNHLADPDTAYRFARGEPVLHPRLRTRVQIDRALDFLVVADHAENLRWQVNTLEGIELLRDVQGYEAALALVRDNPEQTFMLGRSRLDPAYDAALASSEVRRFSWGLEVDAAERHNEPGRFTTFAGWEWSSNGGGSNLHRVVFSPSAADILKRFAPFSNAESLDPEDLWDWLDATAAATGAEFVAIPHNSNLSAGYMFAATRFDGGAIDADYSSQRARLEPVMEITQVKGTSETHPALSPNDELAGFEIYEKLLGGGAFRPLAADYARTGLLTGLAIQADVGVNPYAFGFIGSTDSHTGLSSFAEDDFQGKAVSDALPAERLNRVRANFQAWEMSAAGLAAVWADGNTREAITQAFRRREVYATSGTRIRLRVFAGYDFPSADALPEDIAALGYRRGVPMGADLGPAPRNRATRLLIEAVQDPVGAGLERIQVVKGWLAADGTLHESVIDAARSPDAGGSARLVTVWEDPDFAPGESAFYYVRVLEVPTPRHSSYDASALGVDVSATAMPATIQERAWSSPVWYRAATAP